MLPVYAELYCRSNFSFQQGASHPKELVDTAYKLGYRAIAITDECSLAGSVRAHTHYRKMLSDKKLSPDTSDFRIIVGASFKVGESYLVLLAQSRSGYGDLCELITKSRRGTIKGTYRLDICDLSCLRDCYAIIIPTEDCNELLRATEKIDRAIGFSRLLTATDALFFEHAQNVATQYKLPMTACGDVDRKSVV